MLNQTLIPEFKHEAASTRKILERVPVEKFNWKPHEKSFTLGRLAAHITEIPNWMTVTLTTEELDFAKAAYNPVLPATGEQLMQLFQSTYEKALQTLEGATDDTLRQPWTLRRGEHIIFTLPRLATLRSFVLNHFIHHRGQLSVYLRLLDVPVPGLYGPSADEK